MRTWWNALIDQMAYEIGETPEEVKATIYFAGLVAIFTLAGICAALWIAAKVMA